MAIVIGSDSVGNELKEVIKRHLQESGQHCIDVTGQNVCDFVDATLHVAQEVKKNDNNLGIVIDAYGVGSFMTATKLKGMIAAQVSDERSAYMTREHNNSRIMTIGSEIVGHALAKNIVDSFIHGKYDGGRHQIRVDMLNKMC
ncbi:MULTISPECIES: galactose-6-phosphate isomerase subunit LacA [unclassified Granulicatella]|uniref:galactose-6-phosphate isomerase subunit LacA n=1 Tax=unclassified Granulicatella TaxID=2630493 RepID=UPI0010749AF9|nr:MULTISPECIES: galactose-6-phosphate isomerase subunit LacA [unclassified Granulicatella]MBF0779734.1 galactose-6-phosphate isomerase subunit LacA [Granulicatella sp. 19428wC4_WM01]TFU96253.1 galactose-6-phosphate isomerase subunit LacA [Granulicatella sp. WM01]